LLVEARAGFGVVGHVGLSLAAALRPGGACSLTAEELDVAGHHLGGVPGLSFGVLPAPRPQAALDKHLPALTQVAGAGLGRTAEDDDVVPFGVVRPGPIWAFLPLAGRQAEAAHGRTRRCPAGLGFGAQVAEESDAIDVSHKFSYKMKIEGA